jgi:hypothetical protein
MTLAKQGNWWHHRWVGFCLGLTTMVVMSCSQLRTEMEEEMLD